jgi:hypothetical protein
MRLFVIIFYILSLSCGQSEDLSNPKQGKRKNENSMKVDIDSNDTPKSIEEAISYFLTKWTTHEKNQFKNEKEDAAVAELHLSVGMFIRNNWIRHGSGNERLISEFKKLGIFAPDDMSGIILRSVHRKLNNLPIDIEAQVKHYINFWNEIHKRENLADKVAIQTYNKFHVGDKVKIYMYVDTIDGQRSACIIESKNGWTFNPKKDLLITGILKKKYFKEDKTSSFFIVRVLNMNFKNTTVFMDSVSINKDHEFLIRKLRIE